MIEAVDGWMPPCTVSSENGNMMSPPASISYDVAENGSSGMVSRDDRNDPADHISAEVTQSAIPPSSPRCPTVVARTATPANPTPTPARTGQGTRSPPASRRTTSQSGTEAMIRDASPVGTFRSAKKRTAFAPGSRIPMITTERIARREIRSVPPRSSTTPAISAPAVMKRVDAAKSGGIVLPA